MKFAAPPGFSTGTDFESYLRDSLETLLAEGGRARLKMLSIGLHARLSGRPGRAAALARFLDRVAGDPEIWVCRRADIARHWLTTHPAQDAPA